MVWGTLFLLAKGGIYSKGLFIRCDCFIIVNALHNWHLGGGMQYHVIDV